LIDDIINFAKKEKLKNITAYSLMKVFSEKTKHDFLAYEWRRIYVNLIRKLKDMAMAGEIKFKKVGRNYYFSFGDKNDKKD